MNYSIFKDPISGLKVQSDRVYYSKSKLVKSFAKKGYSDFFGVKELTAIEYELSGNYLILTLTGKIPDGPNANQPITERVVYNGSFSVGKKDIVTGEITSDARGRYYSVMNPEVPWKTNEAIESFEYTDGVFKNPKQFMEVVSKQVTTEEDVKFFYRENKNPEFEMHDREWLGFNATYDSDKSELKNLGLDKFLGGAWWANPYDGNLV